MTMTEQTSRELLGEKIKEVREYLGYSQDEVASVLRISRSAVSLIESGQRKVDVLELQKIASLFERPLSDFTGERTSEAGVGAPISVLARMASDLNKEDLEELRKFAEYLQARARSKTKKR